VRRRIVRECPVCSVSSPSRDGSPRAMPLVGPASRGSALDGHLHDQPCSVDHARGCGWILWRRGPFRTHPHHNRPRVGDPSADFAAVARRHALPPVSATPRSYLPSVQALTRSDGSPADRPRSRMPGAVTKSWASRPTPGPEPHITPHIAAGLRDLDTRRCGADRCAPRSNIRGRCPTACGPAQPSPRLASPRHASPRLASPQARPRPRPRRRRRRPRAADLDTPSC